MQRSLDASKVNHEALKQQVVISIDYQFDNFAEVIKKTIKNWFKGSVPTTLK
jgi:hypothetical protein